MRKFVTQLFSPPNTIAYRIGKSFEVDIRESCQSLSTVPGGNGSTGDENFSVSYLGKQLDFFFQRAYRRNFNRRALGNSALYRRRSLRQWRPCSNRLSERKPGWRRPEPACRSNRFQRCGFLPGGRKLAGILNRNLAAERKGSFLALVEARFFQGSFKVAPLPTSPSKHVQQDSQVTQ